MFGKTDRLINRREKGEEEEGATAGVFLWSHKKEGTGQRLSTSNHISHALVLQPSLGPAVQMVGIQ